MLNRERDSQTNREIGRVGESREKDAKQRKRQPNK